MYNPKILVTGAGGFVGKYIALELVKAGFPVFATYRGEQSLALEEAINLNNNSTYAQGDILDPRFLRSINETFNPDIIFHFAGMGNAYKCESNEVAASLANATSVFRLKTEFRDSTLVFASTDRVMSGFDAALDGSPEVLTEESKTSPVTIYDKSKDKGERFAAWFRNTLGMRLPIIFGNDIDWGDEGQKNRWPNAALYGYQHEDKPQTIYINERRKGISLQTLASGIRAIVDELDPSKNSALFQYALNAGERRILHMMGEDWSRGDFIEAMCEVYELSPDRFNFIERELPDPAKYKKGEVISPLDLSHFCTKQTRGLLPTWETPDLRTALRATKEERERIIGVPRYANLEAAFTYATEVPNEHRGMRI